MFANARSIVELMTLSVELSVCKKFEKVFAPLAVINGPKIYTRLYGLPHSKAFLSSQNVFLYYKTPIIIIPITYTFYNNLDRN